MRIGELVNVLDGAKIINNNFEKTICGISFDSRTVKSGELFFCLTGGKTDPYPFAEEAAEKGACAIVTEKELPFDATQITVPDARKALSLCSSAYYGFPCRKLKIIGITGTNGKTTTAFMLASILKNAGKKVGVIGTLGIFYGKKEIAPELTTPDPVFLHEIFADMVKTGIEYVAMEVSAHAIFYEKIAGIEFESCIFTNLSQDHLDFFGSIKEYAKTKSEFVCSVKNAVINGDDEFGREFGKERKKKGLSTLWYGLETPCDTFAVVTNESVNGSDFVLNLSDELCKIYLPIAGRHNVYNAMGASTCALSENIAVEYIAEGLKKLPLIKGRLEKVGVYKGANVFVDFAHTPDGIEKTLKSLRPYVKGKLVILFGCGGNRDKDKRPKMGEIAGKFADFSVLTSDNPRYEDPYDILEEVSVGINRFTDRYVVMTDRRKATVYALSLLKKGDILLVAGKGAEDYQEIMGIKYEYNDKDVIVEEIARLSETDGN